MYEKEKKGTCPNQLRTKEFPHIYDKYLIGNHVEVKFTDINPEEFKKIINAAFLLIQDN